MVTTEDIRGRRPTTLLRRVGADLRYDVRLRGLPPRVAWFRWRARRVAQRTADPFSLIAATRPADLALLLRLAHDRRRVVELGTGTAWTTLALALADRQREVISYDPIARTERERYLALVNPGVRARVRLIAKPGSTGPTYDDPVDLLYVDSSHTREDTIAELRAWQPALRPGALVVLDDYTHKDYPGVREAVAELGLPGNQRGTLFVHEVAASG
ncbi:MAG TPA: class I SAM-dependent methyltransferase [Solirubrobacteraceae bacterium]|nr:class I SAM-dependent methyltransferase [Solirubrobacteraceae bacterium]